MTIQELVEVANNGYPDNYLERYFDQKTGKAKSGPGDGLAEFILRELVETFDATADKDDQIEEAIRLMENAIRDIRGVINALRREQ